MPEAKINPQGSGVKKMSVDNKNFEREENVADIAASVNKTNQMKAL